MMITVKLNKPEFEYDIHSLIKAFYPEETVRVAAEEKRETEPLRWEMRITYEGWETETGRTEKRSLGEDGAEAECGLLPGSVRIDWRESGEGGACLPGCSFAVDFADRTDTKNRLKRNLYRLLSDYTGQSLPWGTLTGIRPTKIAMKFLEQGKDRDEIRRYMKETYDTSAEKTELSMDIAQRELELLQKIDYQNGYSLYIGIPFCPTTCLYCSFTSFPLHVWAERVDEYLDALEQEIDFAAAKYARKHLNAVYIGGGTPTTLEPYQLDRLISKIKSSFDLSDCLEFTVEAGRPDSITAEKLAVLRRHGISRISINPQTMKEETLQVIGRRHTVRQTIDSFHMARELGFDNINMDLIMGLPGETLDDVRETLEQLRALAPDNITVHSLALKRAARLNMFREDYKDFEMVNTQAHMDLAADYAKRMGLAPYYLYRQKSMAGNLENVGYARPGKAGVYNVLMMEEVQDIVALGAGSISKRVYANGRIERCENVKNVAQYIERIGEMIERKRALFGTEEQ